MKLWNKCFVIFWYDTTPQKSDFGGHQEDQAEELVVFPHDWNHIPNKSYSHYDKDERKNDSFLMFESEESAVNWIKANLRSNSVYKVTEWLYENSVKSFANCPALEEVSEA